MKAKPSIALVSTTLLLLSVVLVSCVKDIAESPKQKPIPCEKMQISYAKHIEKEILLPYCSQQSGCHGAGENDEMYDYNTLVVYIDDGSFKERVLDKKDMPSDKPLPDSLLRKIECWLKDGHPNN